MILPMARLRTVSQVTQLQIDEEDVLHGFVDVECGSHVEVRSNSRCRIAFRTAARWFSGVRIYGFPRAIEFGHDGGDYIRPLERHRTSTYRLSYRFILHPETRPGTYQWPLELTLGGDFDEAALRAA